VPNVTLNANGNSKIVKKGSNFLALIDPYIPPKQIATTGSTLISSEDGINWNNINVELPGTYFSIISTPTFYYAVGHSLGSNKLGSIVRSTDGYTWEEVFVSKSNLYDIAMTDDTLVAVGINGDIATSKDGIEWEEKSLGNYSFYNISYSDNEWVVAGGIHMFSTKDRENWTFLDNNSLTEGTQNNLYANGKFLLMSNSLTRVYDGNSFKYINRESNLKEVVYNNRFLNLEDKNVSISSDGIVWSKIAEMKLADENTTGLNIEKSFISGSDVIFQR